MYDPAAMPLRASATAIGVFFFALQAFVLPPDGFITGDQGSKYLQTRAFAERGPFDPSIDIQARDIDPDYRHQEPKLKNRKGRLVSEFLWLLPMASAPFMAAFGIRGMYVVPALAALVVFFCAGRLGATSADPRGVIAAWIVLLVTPIVFYGSELWEHAPAAACVIAAAVLLAPDRDPAVRGPGRLRSFAAGALVGSGFLFREEVVVALPALLIARSIALDRDRVRDLMARAAWSGAGLAVALIASMPVNEMMYGAVLPMHLTQDAWEYAKNISYLQVRRDIVTELFLPAEQPALYAAAMIAGIAASLHALRRRGESRAGLAIVHLAVAIVVGIAVVLPLWRLAAGVRPHDTYKVTSAAHTWAFMPALLYWPWLGAPDRRPAACYLVLSGVLVAVFSAVIVPSIGGGQWSPRFFLPVAPLLALPAAEIAQTSTGRRWTMWAVRGVLLAAFVMQASGMAFLWRAKDRTAAITHTFARLSAPGDVVISDVFWFPEVTATLAPTRRMLFAWSSSDVPAVAALPVRAGIDRFTVVTLPQLTGRAAPPSLDVPNAPCRFVKGREYVLDAVGLTLSRYSCAAP